MQTLGLPAPSTASHSCYFTPQINPHQSNPPKKSQPHPLAFLYPFPPTFDKNKCACLIFFVDGVPQVWEIQNMLRDEPEAENRNRTMKAYKITATIINADITGKTYLTRAAAESEAEYLAEEHPEHSFSIQEEDFLGFVVAQVYDEKSVRERGFTISDDGYQVGDYFDHEGKYLGADEYGIEPTHYEL